MTTFDKLANLIDLCEALHGHLEEARKHVAEEVFDELMEGPLQEVICGAMDVEDAWMQCEAS